MDVLPCRFGFRAVLRRFAGWCKGGAGIAIDLGASRVQPANDNGDSDIGANGSQNYPMIKGIVPCGATRTVSAVPNSRSSTSDVVDSCLAPTCDGVNGPDAATFLGSKIIDAPNGLSRFSQAPGLYRRARSAFAARCSARRNRRHDAFSAFLRFPSRVRQFHYGMSKALRNLLDVTRVHRLALGLGMLALLAAGPALASVICVPSDATLANAIAQANAGPEGSTWDIRIHTGTYNITDSVLFLPDGDKDNKTFKMTGGWTGANNTCQGRQVDPSTTIIHGIASTPDKFGTQFLFLGDNASYDIESIRFENFSRFTVDDKLCLPYNICPDTDTIVLQYNQFDNGESVQLVVTDARRVTFRNNLVTHLHPIDPIGSGVDYAPVGIDIQNDEDAPQISFNTFANIECAGTMGGVQLVSHQSHVALHHNIFQTTGCPHDLYIDPSYGGQPQTPYYNLYLDIGGSVLGNLATNGNVLNFNPKFVDTASSPGNYRLLNDSPAVNKGATPVGMAQLGFIASYIDLDGALRPVGTRWDLGAYESAVNDGAPPTITVTNTNDSGAGSLRAAITSANGAVGSAQKIVFDIPGSCPRTILLDAPLPLVTDSLVIDGYTQPGANANTLDLGSDANVCIVIGPAATMAYALEVDNAEPDATQLTVRGLAFANSFYTFTGAPIELRSGGGHIVSGNVFGGYFPPSNNTAQVGGLGRAILVRGTATDVKIGGADNADRNYFGFMGQNAIVLNDATSSGHTIQNNYIGVRPNGLAVQANSASGISASGGSGVTIVDNAICASDNGIELLGAATTGFTIQRNNIGVNAAGFGSTDQANNIGIEIALGSGQHVIGATANQNLQTGTYSNLIDNNNSAGILVAANAGGYNSIRGNLIEANGRGGSGLGIDLDAIGPLANDAGDTDTGPNLSQNYPRIRGAAPAGANQTLNMALNTTPSAAVRIDVYRSASCPGGAKGANATTLVGSTDVNSGASGVVNFTATVTKFDPPGFLTATATTSAGHTSELAPCVREDTIFTDGYQTPGL